MKTPTDEQILEHARQARFPHGIGTELVIGGCVNRDEDGRGAYVEAWVWVEFADMREET